MKMAWVVALCALSCAAQAEELYKCRLPNGKTVYADMPCETVTGEKKSDEKVVSLGQPRVGSGAGPVPYGSSSRGVSYSNDLRETRQGKTVVGEFDGHTSDGTPVRVRGSVTPLR